MKLILLPHRKRVLQTDAGKAEADEPALAVFHVDRLFYFVDAAVEHVSVYQASRESMTQQNAIRAAGHRRSISAHQQHFLVECLLEQQPL